LSGQARSAGLEAYGGSKFQYESNLFRQPTDASVPGARPKSDRLYSALAGLSLTSENETLDAALSASASRTWFDRNGDLDFTGYTLKGHVKKDWTAIHLTLEGQQDRRLSSFSDIRTSNRNVQTLTLLRGEVGAAVAGDWRVLLGAALTRSVNSASLVETSDYRRVGLKAGFGYYSPVGNAIALQFTHANGRGLNPQTITVDAMPVFYRQDYTENGVELALLYMPSVATALQLQLGYVDRQDRSAFDNDFSGIIGQASFNWNPRDTLRFTLNAGRRLETESFIYSDSVRVKYAGLAAEGDIDPRITVKAGFQYTEQRYAYDIQVPTPLQQRTEKLKILSGGIDYRPGDRFRLTVEASREMRSANQPGYDYDANVARVTARISIGHSAEKRPGDTAISPAS
jgi:hypothetical protein